MLQLPARSPRRSPPQLRPHPLQPAPALRLRTPLQPPPPHPLRPTPVRPPYLQSRLPHLPPPRLRRRLPRAPPHPPLLLPQPHHLHRRPPLLQVPDRAPASVITSTGQTVLW